MSIKDGRLNSLSLTRGRGEIKLPEYLMIKMEGCHNEKKDRR
jgi:hypothetical protein